MSPKHAKPEEPGEGQAQGPDRTSHEPGGVTGPEARAVGAPRPGSHAAGQHAAGPGAAGPAHASASSDAGSDPGSDPVAPSAPSPGVVPQQEPAGQEPAGQDTEAAVVRTPGQVPPRAAARGGRRRRRSAPTVRSRWMWGALAIVGVALLGWVLVAALGPDRSARPTPTTSSTAPAEQQTLLIQVRNDADLGADNLVAGVGGGLPAAQLLVPSRLIVDVPGAGQQTLGQSARLLDRTASQDALSDLLALRIDGTLSLSRLALAGMVDYVGGITLTVDTAITEVDEETGVETVVVPAGTQKLNGTQAAAYALTWLPEEPEANRLARYSAVMSQTIAQLPDDAVSVQQMLTSLGGSARTTTTTEATAEFLLRLREGIGNGDQLVRVLPTTDIEAPGDLAVVRVDLSAAQETIDSVLPQATLEGSEAARRVLVQNGVGTPGLGAVARDRLVGAGMVFINGGNAETFGQSATVVLVPDAGTQAMALGTEIAEALGVPASAVAVAEEGQNVADAVVVLGSDFAP